MEDDQELFGSDNLLFRLMKRRTTRRRAKHPEPELPADEVDAFHEQNDRVMLDGADPNSEEDEDFKDPESMLDLDGRPTARTMMKIGSGYRKKRKR
eukprot:271167-Amorphochlora_amoeboformis.AAC.1